MGDPATLVETSAPPVITAIPTVIAGETQDGTKAQSASKNGKKADSGSGGGSFFTWFIVLALLGVWTSVAVVYFDLVDYQGVLDEKPGDEARRGAQKETSPRDAGLKLREALKQQLAIIHERVEAKKIAKLALAEVRQLLAKEEEEKELELGRKDISAKVKERVAARLKEEEEKMEKEEMEKALEKLQKGKANEEDEKKEEESEEEKGGEKRSKKGKEERKGEGKRGQEEDKERGRESGKEKRKKSKAEKSDRGKK